ncbi:MAG: TolC family protein [Rhodospirillaceae bacterium]|jgi:outer membrane protein, heavy metal efflux system|nr:TolC family protein [Rhodospirillaceae bacterium]MBT5239964.1 TolC family protein [Rhodospirillaceae bacterium]MBT5564374.1 TolC family protein [Rhodospirillaceae bacterium]MBT6090063.1 TolC family protein [Rhodospirillaceae bacterium]MBT6959537.1 TolC family protein [Rhodospirillaceae bacterium]
MTNCIHFGVRLHVLLRLVCIALVLGSPTISVAQTPLSLSDVLSDALRNSSDVARLDRDLALRLADAIETETRTNPEVEVMARYSDKGEGAGLELEFSQPLRFSDFTLRPLYAAAIRQAATVEQEAGLFDLVNRVTELYLAHWAAQSREAMARNAVDEATTVTDRIERIRSEQVLPTVQFNVFVPEALRRREEATLHAAERAVLEARLAFETGGDGRAFISIAAAPSPLPPLEQVVAFAADKDFGARLARGRITVNEARLSVAEKDRMPLITPRVNYEIDPGGADRVWGLGIAVEVPLWDRNGAEVARAQAALQQARLHLAQLNGGAREALVVGLYRQVTLLDARATAYNTKIVPAYRKTYQDIRAIYDQGQTDLLDLWQVQASLLDAEEDAITTVIDALTARVALERAIGGKIEQVN